MDPLSAFSKQQYLNLETFRKSGESVSTPVWFVELNGVLIIMTEAASGKVKRMRRNRQVRVAPCTVNGHLLGEWHPGKARFVSSEEISAIKTVFLKKYGVQLLFFDLLGKMRRQNLLFIAIQIEPISITSVVI